MDQLRMSCTFLLALAAIGLPTARCAYTYSLENNLRTLLFTTNSYQLQARPSANVEVNITLNIITFNKLDVRDQSLTTTGYFSLSWTDGRLDWSGNPTYNTDIGAIYSDENTVWRPPLIVENSVNDISVMSDDSIPIRVVNDGSVSWNPSGIYSTQCDTDVTFYPFDTQVCDITLSTWGYTSNEITLNLDTAPVDFTYFKENGEWEFSEYTTSSSSSSRMGNSFAQLNFHLSLKRRPVYHVLNTLIPTIFLAFLSCMVFKLPAESGERIGYSLTVLLSYAVYLTLVATNIPTTSVNTSLLSVYLVFILALGMISVLLTILVLECHHADPDTDVPAWLLKTTNFLMMITVQKRRGQSRCCCIAGRNKNDVHSLNTDSEQPKQHTKDNKHSKPNGKAHTDAANAKDENAPYTWIEVGRLMDKSLLRIFLFVVLLVTFTFMLSLSIGYAIN